ncbi:heavy metal translocating P-type ATPase [Mycobacteroides abscessus]|uniref:heavy metal translocating P-type ATPase n=1 Tax=Mycobacteroides abscessus TaxID=36809 RepID=UPI00092CA1C7|nr:heavy metal translocating P-type ATPase [Mycobacteroides abscessus]SIK23527.1 heavy metal translocating P-type ATPase [Mycobacteroides abscessus subsp. abscessus]SIM51815.1 heavy metal translocating P-type ATPase [Mycobacteroides abscessus subsp. abscessus]SLF28775.1 heavy metal translocating P-type ATPase [Mycobacteroides abscessus subsp. abscessus]SLH60960.1 heavy metal translocating P-type ATPase [Mycobacteroides abscessus subsp. abscessus]
MSSQVLSRGPVHAGGGEGTAVRTRAFALPEVRWAAVATVLFALGVATQYGGAAVWVWWVLYLACYVTGGWEPGLAGVRALRRRTLDVDLLMIVAAICAAGIGQVLDGALLIVIFATSGALEAFLTRRTADSVRSLLNLAPERATVITASGDERVVDAAALAVGEVIVVRPGERIAADGQVTFGASDVDQASITGEPLPVAKGLGDEVFAGTLNGTGVLRVRVDRAAADTVVARIVAMVQGASATKANAQLFIEKVEQYYSLGVVATTVLVFLVPLALGAAVQPSLLRAMTFMIVASPCAVVLATMPPLLSAMANAGRHGVLVKSAVVMERLGSVSLVAFDKTGTLTRGTPELSDIRPLRGAGLDAEELLTLAAATEHPSEHPLGAAVVGAATDRGLTLPMIDAFESAPGRGVRAVVDGRQVVVGSPTQLLATGPSSAASARAAAVVAGLEAEGKTAVVVLVDDDAVGVLGLDDQVRVDGAETVTALTALTGATPVLLTGDNARAATALAGRVGIHDVRAGLLPQDKVGAVREFDDRGHRVLLVGDGVNDAPALAASHTGIAMGRAGSDLALETADAVVVRDELATIPKVIMLSRRARRVVIANLVIASSFITVLVLWDLLGHLPLPLGVAGHEGSTVIVGLNGMRLLSRRAWRLPTRSASRA